MTEWVDGAGIAARIRYRNYRGEITERIIRPKKIRLGCTQWHPKVQWILEAYDYGKEDDRDFAMADVLEWKSCRRKEEEDG